jgi:hypothetical protein
MWKPVVVSDKLMYNFNVCAECLYVSFYLSMKFLNSDDDLTSLMEEKCRQLSNLKTSLQELVYLKDNFELSITLQALQKSTEGDIVHIMLDRVAAPEVKV